MEFPPFRRLALLLALLSPLGACDALGIPGQPPPPPRTLYSIHGAQGDLLAVARMKPAIFQGDELHFWGTFENRSKEPLEITTRLRWIGHDEIEFLPGRFAPIAELDLPPGRSLGNFVVFELPFGFEHDSKNPGELELEIQARTPGTVGTLAKVFPVPEFRPSVNGGYVGTTYYHSSTTSGSYSGGKTTVRTAPPPKFR